MSQSRKYYTQKWARTSLELILGLIGGFIGLVWQLLAYMLGGYETFRFKQELISEAYTTTTPERMKADHEPGDYDEAR